MGKQARQRRARRDPATRPAAPAAAPPAPAWWQSPWRVGLAAIALLVMIVSAASMLR